MTENKDIRFTEKKIDDSWKDQVSKDKSSTDSKPAHQNQKTSDTATSQKFIQLLNSLSYQALMVLEDVATNPDITHKNKNLAAAKEIIDLINVVKEKTKGNLSKEENDYLNSLLPELQLKFTQLA